MAFYPVTLNIRNKRCLVVGGGNVASRKIEALLPCEPVIQVISPVVCPKIADLAEQKCIDWKQRAYREGDLSGATLVFAATDDPEIQKRVAAEADAAGILVNVITDPDACGFQVPAMFRQGELLITVATAGGSPALAARIRKKLEREYGPEYGLLLALLAGLRKQVVESSDDPVQHKRIFENLLDSDILASIKMNNWTQVEKCLQAVLPKEIEVSDIVKQLQIQENTKMESLPC